ncbi:MAG: plasmid recombination protein [Roseburia sp.]|nr:plasmid recombination protein [Roseburia sp.]
MEKYKRQEVSPVEEENERDENYKTSNPQIDSERTQFNYHIINPRKSYIEFINERIATLTLSRKLRSDAIYMNSFVISSDGEFFKNLPPQQQWQFFKDCTNFFAEKYGRDNIISAIVHVDETTPHLHLNFVPINGGRLSSKSLFDRQKLAQLQTELWEQVGQKYGLKRGKIGSTATHLSAAEHKAKKIIENAEERSAEIDEQTEKKKGELAKITQTINAVTEAQSQPLPKKKRNAESEITALRTKTVLQEQEIAARGRDQHELFTQLQEERRKSNASEAAFKMVSEMLAAYPDEFDALLKKAREKKNPPTIFHGNDNRNGKYGK